MTAARPLISVLITAHNRERLILGAIESVLRSTYSEIEVIVVDDASTDGTLNVAQQCAAADSRVRVYANEANLGDYPNRNRAASYARGEYLKYLDSDDFLYPHALAVMLDCIESHPAAAFGLSALPDPACPNPRCLTPHESYREHFLIRDLFGRAPGSAIIRRSAFQAVGGFSGKRQVGDHELWLALGRRFPLVTMPMDLVWDRQHSSQEQRYDPPLQKLMMHHAIDLAALDEPECPLDDAERTTARRRLADVRARAFWRSLLSSEGMRAAPRALDDLGLGAADLAAWVWRRGAAAVQGRTVS